MHNGGENTKVLVDSVSVYQRGTETLDCYYLPYHFVDIVRVKNYTDDFRWSVYCFPQKYLCSVFFLPFVAQRGHIQDYSLWADMGIFVKVWLLCSDPISFLVSWFLICLRFSNVFYLLNNENESWKLLLVSIGYKGPVIEWLLYPLPTKAQGEEKRLGFKQTIWIH